MLLEFIAIFLIAYFMRPEEPEYKKDPRYDSSWDWDPYRYKR